MDLIGEKPYNKVLGLFASINTAGYALGAPITNLCYDLTNSYNFAIYVSCGLMLVAVIALQYVFRASKNQRKSVENAD
jgi:predicted MFS family arabinose efflux permease